MKKLILMRHGDAPRGIGDDRDRELSIDGALGVDRTANYLLSNYNIDHILCSPIKRNKQTLGVLLEIVGASIPVEFHKEIYSNDPSILQELVRNCNASFSTILLLGHNPSLLEFALKCDIKSYSEWMDEIDRGFRPAEIIAIEFKDAKIWEDAMRDGGKIKDIFIP